MRFGGEGGKRWTGEVLRGLVGVFGGVRGEDGDGDGEKNEEEAIEEVKRELGVVGKLLVEAVRAGDDVTFTAFQKDIERLVEVDARFRDVFGGV